MEDYDLSRAADRALRHVEVSFRSDCSPTAFSESLRTGKWSSTTRAVLTLFIKEGDEQMILDLVTDVLSTFAVLGRFSEELLPPDHPTARFLKAPPQ